MCRRWEGGAFLSKHEMRLRAARGALTAGWEWRDGG